MAYEVEWADSALAGLTESVDYIAKDSLGYAAALALRADQAAMTLREFPSRGRRVREYRDPAIRELIVARRYRLIYQVSSETVIIIAFVHTSRDLATYVEDTIM
ncbi:MAG: type II toxin-antitoxin system RelE/ParE family toxin [Acidobacteriota bacterium]